jgi:hypothetical protein
VETNRGSLTDNISSVTISPETADQIQHGQEIGHPESRKGILKKSSSSEIVATTVNEGVWAAARRRAEEIASVTLGYSEVENTEDVQRKIHTLANSLIVVSDDVTVTVYNNTEQARDVRRQAKRAKKSQD